MPGPILICLVSAAALQMNRSAQGSWSGDWNARKVPCSLIQALLDAETVGDDDLLRDPRRSSPSQPCCCGCRSRTRPICMRHLCRSLSSYDFISLSSKQQCAGPRPHCNLNGWLFISRRWAAHDNRLEATARYLADEALDALVAVNFGHNSFLESHAVFVLSGVRPVGESAVVVDRDGRSTLIVTPAWDAERAAGLSRTSKTIGTDDLAGTLAAGCAGAPHRPAENASRSACRCLGKAWRTASSRFLGGKARADENFVRELARLRKSARSSRLRRRQPRSRSAATSTCSRSCVPACASIELVAELYCFMKELGAEDNFLLVSASQHNLAVRAAGNRVLDVGDIILSEITPCYQGQFAQLCRTTVIGDAGADPAREIRRAAGGDARRPEGRRAGRDGAARCARRWTTASAPPATATIAVRPTCACAATALASRPTFPATWSTRANASMEAGMTFVMHPNQYLPGDRLPDVRRAGA